MKQRSIDVFECTGKELVNLALKLDSSNKMEENGGRKERSPICRARHDAIMALGSLIRVVAVLLKG